MGGGGGEGEWERARLTIRTSVIVPPMACVLACVSGVCVCLCGEPPRQSVVARGVVWWFDLACASGRFFLSSLAGSLNRGRKRHKLAEK